MGQEVMERGCVFWPPSLLPVEGRRRIQLHQQTDHFPFRYCNRTFVLMSTKGSVQPDGHPAVTMLNPILLQVVVVQNPKYFKKFATVVQKADARTVSNYLMWRAVSSSLSSLNEEARDELYKSRSCGKTDSQ